MKCTACELYTKPMFRSLYSVIRATSSSVFLLQLNITLFEYSLYLLAITHRLPEFSCVVSDLKIILSRLNLMVVRSNKSLNLVNSNPGTYLHRQREKAMHFMQITRNTRISTLFTKTVSP